MSTSQLVWVLLGLLYLVIALEASRIRSKEIVKGKNKRKKSAQNSGSGGYGSRGRESSSKSREKGSRNKEGSRAKSSKAKVPGAPKSCKSCEKFTPSPGRKRPNIIFIMADDLGWNDVGFHNKFVQTPNIDWLAKNGIELTDAHALPLCSPSRASLLTGKYASNNGMQQLVQLGQSKSCLPIEHKLWPEYMKDAGYTTKMVGKWHLGSCNTKCLPTNRGFDEFRGILENQAGYFNWTDLGVMNRLVGDKPSTENIGTHLAIQHRLDTVQMIKSHADSRDPLFMYISPLAVHQPLEVTKDMFNRHSSLRANKPEENQRRLFLGLVAAVDDLVGATIKALKETGQYENSIIIFTSDNGGPSGDLNFPAPFPFQSYGNNYPLRGGKSSFFDGGTKAPTVFFRPTLTRLQRGTKRNFLMHITDWLPTTLDLADYSTRSVSKLDGISQKRNLGLHYKPSEKYSVRSEQLIAITDYTSPTLTSVCSNADAAYRWKDWKLIYGRVATAVESDQAELWIEPIESPNVQTITGDSCMKSDGNGGIMARCLFNLGDDPLEQKDLFDVHPNIVKKLLARINHFKGISVRSVFANPLGNTPETVRSLGSFTVPRFDFCTPEIDFPLKRRKPSCRI